VNTAATSLPVYYPDGGRLLLMQWWTESDRGHVVLARSESAMRVAAQRVFHKHPYASLRDYLDIEIVAPSLRLCALAAEHTRRDQVESFRMEMAWRMREAQAAGRVLPAPFSVCASYEPDEELSGADEDDWAKRSHYSCRHCKEGIVLAMTPEELHARYAEAWRVRQTPKPPHRADRRRVASRARVAADDEPLCFANAVFGHHASGIVLGEVDLAAAEEYRPSYLSERALFFYRLLSKPDSSHLQAILDAERDAWDAAHKHDEEEGRREREREEQERIDTIISFFTS